MRPRCLLLPACCLPRARALQWLLQWLLCSGWRFAPVARSHLSAQPALCLPTRSGVLPRNQRVRWRGNSAVNDLVPGG